MIFLLNPTDSQIPPSNTAAYSNYLPKAPLLLITSQAVHFKLKHLLFKNSYPNWSNPLSSKLSNPQQNPSEPFWTVLLSLVSLIGLTSDIFGQPVCHDAGLMNKLVPWCLKRRTEEMHGLMLWLLTRSYVFVCPNNFYWHVSNLKEHALFSAFRKAKLLTPKEKA